MSLLAVLALTFVLAACGSDDDEGGSGDVKTDKGVTEEPCPGSRNADRGCIFLGTLSDLTEGPFAPLGVTIVDGQKAFWDRVNAEGGIGGQYDVDVERYVRDNKYNPQEHVARLREIEPDVLALAQSLGTPMTIAALPIMDQNDLVASPATWWSGWAFEDEDTVLESGQSYCIEAMNGLDYAAEEFGKPSKVLHVGYPGDYGGDGRAGTETWGEENDVEIATLETAPNAAAGNQDAVISAIRRERPEIVYLNTGPTEMAEIVGKAVAGGFDGEFVGSVPTYNPAVLESEAGEAIKAKYRFAAPWGPYGSDTAAHRAMEEAVGNGKKPANDGYTFGWIWSYPLKAALEQAVEDGDLTRAGLRAAVEKVTVDYEGALPDRKYGDPQENAVRASIIAKPDERAPLGASVEQESFTGPTAEGFQITEPCASAG
jgi:ABC-type branched-subunit amino acid transport system substrate-binding protein